MPDPTPTLDVLLPLDRAGERLPPADDEPALSALYAHPLPSSGAYVRANMVSTLDGSATGADHVSGSINNPADFRAFTVQRAWADVVLIGAGTARAERYRALSVPAGLAPARAARGQRPELELAVVTAFGELPEVLFDSPRAPLIITVADRPGLDDLRRRVGADRVIVAGSGRVDPASAVTQLADRGLCRVLAEGGPHLLAELVARGVVDELCLTTSPLLVGGDAPRVLAGAPWLAPPVDAVPAHLLHADGTLLGRWLLSAPSGPPLGSQP
ncbi:dihydrofolate reductase family protein [Cellulomonas cellasea]|uniref:dihydrofolate reductase family protein n=1 Tax=Cellulomonas cellasea TaxID=43670 RepID=UPI0025A47DD1|nr:dihydrofolate reductase family protein [Cellulomonas cellasea]MDM8085396.1 dihydrofolate reductase family protein [Cellulomonas cellasea]